MNVTRITTPLDLMRAVAEYFAAYRVMDECELCLLYLQEGKLTVDRFADIDQYTNAELNQLPFPKAYPIEPIM